MNLPTLLILIVVAAALICAVICIAHGHTGGCGGDCSHCSQSCNSKKK